MADVVMPQMGESIVEGTLTKWLKKVGDRVERDEPLFEISTDKVDTEIPSPAAGVLSEILVEEGATVSINSVVARVSEDGGAAVAPAAATAEPAPVPAEPEKVEPAKAQPVVEEASASEEALGPLSPLVRKMARENNIDLAKIKGTGAGGRITKTDVEAYLASPAPVAAPPAPAPVAVPSAVPERPAMEPVAAARPPKARVEPMSNMRAKIAEHMVMSKRTSAHVTTVHRVDMTRITKLRDRVKGEFKERYGFSLTFLSFVVRATSIALREFPIVNASIEGNNIIYHGDVNIGIAVALENGLIVPVIRNVDEKSVPGIQRSIADLANRARSRQLKPDEVQGGTFSITNFGSFGSLFATPVINQPQIGILGCGAVTKEAVVIEDAIAIRSMMYLALTFDHRLIDGALADQFCQKVKSILENWNEEVR
jgi:pyruvate dehydrogenase E2 component (dihydrolipoamide acetyltransferase)